MAALPQMAPAHAKAFFGAASLYNVYILVRRTNLMSLRHIGAADCAPKRLDCKAKTADTDYTPMGQSLKASAGLVVDPTITGAGAFKTTAKYNSALEEWGKFANAMLRPEIRTRDGQKGLTYVPNGGLYFVDLNPKSNRYGCVKFTSSSLMTAGKYIYGDFDLYGIVPASDPARNVAVSEERLGQKHSRSLEFFDVQHYVNRTIGVPMVLHGAQESYGSTHSDEGLDIFHPDGNFSTVGNAAEIAQLYETAFKGRKLFTKSGPKEIVRGMFATPA